MSDNYYDDLPIDIRNRIDKYVEGQIKAEHKNKFINTLKKIRRPYIFPKGIHDDPSRIYTIWRLRNVHDHHKIYRNNYLINSRNKGKKEEGKSPKFIIDGYKYCIYIHNDYISVMRELYTNSYIDHLGLPVHEDPKTFQETHLKLKKEYLLKLYIYEAYYSDDENKWIKAHKLLFKSTLQIISNYNHKKLRKVEKFGKTALIEGYTPYYAPCYMDKINILKKQYLKNYIMSAD